MKKYIILLILPILIVGYSLSPVRASGDPIISSITSTINSLDEVVTISGNGFNFSSALPGYGQENPSQNTLYCNDRNMLERIISWNDESIEFVIGDESSMFLDGYDVNCYISFQGFYAPGESDDTNYFSNVATVVYEPCLSDTWSCDDWSECSSSGDQARSCTLVDDCSAVVNTTPTESQSCNYTPSCTEDIYECDGWSACSSSGTQIRTCNLVTNCTEVSSEAPAQTQSCAVSSTVESVSPSIIYPGSTSSIRR